MRLRLAGIWVQRAHRERVVLSPSIRDRLRWRVGMKACRAFRARGACRAVRAYAYWSVVVLQVESDRVARSCWSYPLDGGLQFDKRVPVVASDGPNAGLQLLIRVVVQMVLGHCRKGGQFLHCGCWRRLGRTLSQGRRTPDLSWLAGVRCGLSGGESRPRHYCSCCSTSSRRLGWLHVRGEWSPGSWCHGECYQGNVSDQMVM